MSRLVARMRWTTGKEWLALVSRRASGYSEGTIEYELATAGKHKNQVRAAREAAKRLRRLADDFDRIADKLKGVRR